MGVKKIVALLSPFGDLVDGGGRCDWDHDTKYYFESVKAQVLWNEHRSYSLRQDDIGKVQDVFVTDYYSATDGKLGRTNYSQEKVYFNDYYFVSGNPQSLSDAERQKTVHHEFGHCLGLGENNSGVASVMRQGRYVYNTLHQDNKDSFDAAALLY